MHATLPAMRLANRGSVPMLRLQFELMMRAIPVPRRVAVRRVSLGGVPAEEITPTDRPVSGTLVYIHGGGYVIGSARTHRAGAARLALHARRRVLLPNYRLAPEHPFPAAPDDILSAWRHLAEREEHLVLAGESAGGGLSAALCLDAAAQGLRLPDKLYLLSPWLDLTHGSAAHAGRNHLEPLLKTRYLESQFARHYAGATGRREPRLSPLFGDVSAFPPTLIHVGTHETLHDDATAMAEKLRAAGVPVTLHAAEGLWHAWPLLAPLFPEASGALREAGHWLRRASL